MSGPPAITGTAYDSSSIFNVTDAGTDINGTSDEFHYVYRALGCDGLLIANVTSQSNTNASAKAGLMIRASVTDPTSPEASISVTPTAGIVFEYRTTTGGNQPTMQRCPPSI